MPAISARKTMNVVRLYLEGHPHQYIADRAGVSKGTVANIIDDLREGRFNAIENLSDQIDGLREVAVELRKSGLSLSQAAMGLSAFQGIESLGVASTDVKNVVEKCRELTPEGAKTQDFLAAVSTVMDVEQRTGMNPKELEETVGELEDRYHILEQSCQELEPISKEVAALTKERDCLVAERTTLELEIQERRQTWDAEIAERTEQLQKLQGQVADTEQLIGQLGGRVLDQEESLRQISCRSDRASSALKQILSLGLSENALPELATRLASAAYHHQIELAQFTGWLFTCLDQAGSLLGLESMIKRQQNELLKEERRLSTARKNQVLLAAELQTLKKLSAEEKAAQKSRRKVWQQEIRAVGSIFTEAATVETEDIKALRRSFDQRLSTQQVELQKTARALGSLEEKIDSYAWIRPLVNLLQGSEGVTSKEVRIAATFLCLALRRYLELHVENRDKPARVGILLEQLLEALERWET